VNGAQRPIELILARNLLSSLSTPALLTDDSGTVVFYNEAAGELLGRRFEECGPMTVAEWGEAHGPFDESGARIPYEELDLARGMQRGRPGHSRFRIRSAEGSSCMIEASGMPIVTGGGQRGGMTFFWESD
jgi:PAS domain-containing protein